MFKSLDSIASVVGIFMYLTISKFKQVLRSRKGLGKVSTTTLNFDYYCSYQYVIIIVRMEIKQTEIFYAMFVCISYGYTCTITQ